ncbi:MAG: hypothetical protein L3K02_01175 [Thermoplasmata archaeon]|nr:hypothetical protein [Thermoplasmata archaeon]
MTRRRPPSFSAEFDVLGVSVGGAVVSGALSVLAPTLAALTGALAVLAVAGWLSLRSQSGGPFRGTSVVRWGGAWAAAGLGGAYFLEGAGALAPFRGLALGLSLVPLWAIARRFPRGGP